MRKLTAKQEKFAQGIALEDMNQAEAYRAAYSTKRMSDKQIWEEACKLANSPKVAQRISELRTQAMTPKVMDARKRREKLTELAMNEDANIAMKAIDLLNKMDGEYIQRIDGSVSVKKLEDLI